MFWPFRLLIAAVMAMAILIMILGTIDYFNQYKVKVSWQRFVEAFENAHNAVTTPDNADKGIKKEEDLTLAKTTLSSDFFAKQFDLPKECITFQAPESSTVRILNGGQAASLTEETVSAAYFLCIYDKTSAECSEHCYISFGLPPETG